MRKVHTVSLQRRKWNKPRVIDEILKLDKLHSTYVKTTNNALWKAAVRYFDSWGKAVEAAGFDYDDIRLPGPTSSPVNKGVGGMCKIPACDSIHHAKGWCKKHYTIMTRPS